ARDPNTLVGRALGKIVQALPEPVAAQAEAVRRTAAPAPDGAAARPDPETTTTLVQACSNHRRVRLGYRSEAGSEWVSEVDPSAGNTTSRSSSTRPSTPWPAGSPAPPAGSSNSTPRPPACPAAPATHGGTPSNSPKSRRHSGS